MKKTDALARLLRKRLAYSIACFALFSLCLVPMWMLGKKFFLLGFVVLALCKGFLFTNTSTPSCS